MLKINYPKATGGKAGKSHNKTSTIRVLDTDTNCIVKQFRYKVGGGLSQIRAYMKADAYIHSAKRIRRTGG